MPKEPNHYWLENFDRYYKEAQKAGDFGSFSTSPVALTTACKNGIPSCRMVLLKKYDKSGFTIYTNMTSKKGWQLTQNPQASLCISWPSINKEFIINGSIKIVDDENSDTYFASRPFQSKVGAHASRQSKPIKKPFELIIRITFFMLKYLLKRKVDRPVYWKGFKVTPEEVIES